MERTKSVAKATKLLDERLATFACTMTLQMGKRVDQARGKFKISNNILSRHAKYAEHFLAPKKVNLGTSDAHI